MGAQNHLTADARWFASRDGMLLLWTGLLAGPIAWAGDLGFSYALVKWSCGHQNELLLNTINLVALALTAGGGYASWRALTIAQEDVPLDGGTSMARPVIVVSRAKFMAILGIVTTLLFAALIVATMIPIWVLDACHS